MGSILVRLAAYEETGLTPAEAAKLAKERRELDAAISRLPVVDRLPKEDYDPAEDAIWEAHLELAKYREAEREGRIVVLPCKVGDIAYTYREYGNQKAIEEHEITGFDFRGGDSKYYSGWSVHAKGCNVGPRIRDLGKTWALTRKEAEAALTERMEKDV